MILGVILPLTALVHSAAFSNGFLNFDDPQQVVQNESIRAITADHIRVFFTTPVVGMYSPLASLSYAVDYAIGGLNVSAFHATNLLLHLLSVCFVCLIVVRLTASIQTASIVTALFALHPVNVASVAPIMNRNGLLYGCFYLAAYLAYVAYVQSAQTWRLVLSFAMFLLAVLAKAPAIVLPALMLLTDAYLHRAWSRRVVLEKIPFLVVSVAFGLLAFAVRPDMTALKGGPLDYSLIERLSAAAYSLVAHLWRLVAPIGLSPLYPYPDRANGHLPWPIFVAPLVAVLGVVVAARIRSQRRVFVFGGGFILIHLALMLKVVPFGLEFMADRYLYLPGIGLFLIAAELVRHASRPVRQAGVAGLAVVVVFFSVRSYARYADWKDNITFYGRTLDRYPSNAAAHNNLAGALDADQRPDEAFLHYQAAVRLEPGYVPPHINVGIFLLRQGKPAEALPEFAEALRLAPNTPEAHTGLAQALAQLGRGPEAITHLLESIRLDPSVAQTHMNLGTVLDSEGRVADAIEQYTAALKLDPNLVEAHTSLGVALASQGHLDAARAHFSEALRLDPNSADAHVHMAIVLANSGDKTGAVQHLRAALAVAPDHQAARQLLEQLLR